jgi:membrane protease YdiL (CAAX protease family)
MFRGLPLGLARGSVLALVLGGLTFVAGHHLVRGNPARASRLLVRYEFTAAAVLAGLVVASGSIWPAVVAHVLANLPSVVLHWQRTRTVTTGAVEPYEVST